MTRLADRLWAVPRPLTAGDLFQAAAWRWDAQEEFASGDPLHRTVQEQRNEMCAALAAARQVTSKDRFDPNRFEAATVVVVDDVARWVSGLPDGTKLEELLGVVAPPFDELFVEAQGLSPNYDIALWSFGVLLSVVEGPHLPRVPDDLLARPDLPWPKDAAWTVTATLVAEWRKRRRRRPPPSDRAA
jgi:hypothetical protein